MKILVCVAWPYANGELHLGHFTGDLLPADVFARYQRLKGNDVLMVSGTDMHGTPVEVSALKSGIEPSSYAHTIHMQHIESISRLKISFDLYTSTDTVNHYDTSQNIFLELYEKGFIFKNKVKQLWSESEKKFLLDRLVEGECPYCHSKDARGDQCDSCGRTLEPIELLNPHSLSGDTLLELKETEDYFLDLPKLQKSLEEWFQQHPNKENWKEMVISYTSSWLKEGLKPRPITRNLKFGIPLPKGMDLDDSAKKVIYVWFEAVIGYLSASIEWNRLKNESIKNPTESYIFNADLSGHLNWKDFWFDPVARHYYFMGKDNIVFHTIIWPAMLLGLNMNREENEKFQLAWDVPANAFLNLEGKKMSKSKNWFVSLKYLCNTYDIDLIRYYFCSRMPENKDSDFKWKDFIDANNKELVGNLGNFVNRTLSFVKDRFEGIVPSGEIEHEVRFEIRDAMQEVGELLDNVKILEAIDRIMVFVGFSNRYFNKTEVWQVVKEDRAKAGKYIFNCIQLIQALKIMLKPFLPDSISKLTLMLGLEENIAFGENQWRFTELPSGGHIGDIDLLFKKLEPSIADEERAKLGR